MHLNHLPSHLHLHQLHHLQDSKLILQNKEDYKSPDIQRVQLKTLHYLLQVHLLNNAITSFSSCAHQKLTDVFLTILMTNMQGRILKEKLKDTNRMRQGRSCSIQRMTNLKIVSNLQFLVIHFYKYYIMYTQEFLLNLNYVCVCPEMLMYLFVCCVCPGISLLLYNSFQSSMFWSLLVKKSSGGLVHMSHEGVGTTVEAKAVSGHFGRDKTVSLLSYFPNITHKVEHANM